MKRLDTSPFASLGQPKVERIISPEFIGNKSVHELGGVVIDLIPENERGKYRYWRGASLGAAAYNLTENGFLNTASDPTNAAMHFATGPLGYAYADGIARSIVQREGYYNTQYPLDMRREIAHRDGYLPTDPTPGIVFALHPDYNDIYLRPSDRGAREGVVWDGAVTLDMIDEHTRDAFHYLFNL